MPKVKYCSDDLKCFGWGGDKSWEGRREGELSELRNGCLFRRRETAPVHVAQYPTLRFNPSLRNTATLNRSIMSFPILHFDE